MNTNTTPLLLTIAEAADLVGIGTDAAYRLVNAGEWPSEAFGEKGGRRMVPRAFLIMRYGLQPAKEEGR